jgi:hypothetical protein
MMYALWLVLGAIGLNVVLGVFRAATSNSFDLAKFTNFLNNGILKNVLPLSVIAYMDPLDPTGWLLKTAYFAGAAGVFINYIIDALRKLRK